MFSLSPVRASGFWRVNVLVVYDEEWESTARYFYGYSPEFFAELFLVKLTDYFYAEFNIRFRPVEYAFWDSDDNPPDADVMMNESIAETGFYTGKEINGYTTHIMVVFTDQDIPGLFGYSDNVLGVVLLEETYVYGLGQATDNLLQHEVSHLYDTDDEYESGLDCVMNKYPYHLDFPWGYVPTCFTTNDWCEDCAATITNNTGWWGYYTSSPPSGGGGGSGVYDYK